MEKDLFKFREFSYADNSNPLFYPGKTLQYSDFISLIKEGRDNMVGGYLIGDSTVGSINSAIKGIGKELPKGSVKDGKVNAGLWCPGIGTNAYLKMIEKYGKQHPEANYVFLAMGANDFYTPTEEIKKNAPKIKKVLKGIFPNVLKFFIIQGAGWGWGEKYKPNYPKWMWKGGNIENGATDNEPAEIGKYYNEVWVPAGFTVIPIHIGIIKDKDGYSKHIGPKTPGVAELGRYINDVLNGKIAIYKEEIDRSSDSKSAQYQGGEDLVSFYDSLQNAINNGEKRARQAEVDYTYDPLVERVQLGLKFLGFDLPLHGADGLFGPETERSVSKFKTTYQVPGEPNVMDNSFFNSLMARLRERGFTADSIRGVVKISQEQATSGMTEIGSSNLGDGESSWVYWLSHNQGSYGAAELLKVALGTQKSFSSKSRPMFMEGWRRGGSNHIVGNVGDSGWDGDYKKRIKAAYDQGNDQLVAKLFTEYQKKKFDQMLVNGRQNIGKHPDLKRIFEKYKNVFPLDFLYAVAYQESKFNPGEGNNKYKGLFALDPNSGYAKKYGLNNQNVHDPEKNTEVAVKFWSDNRKDFNSKMTSNELAALGLDRSTSNMA